MNASEFNHDYCDCGEELDKDCNGDLRCVVCDGPCPCCYDGGMEAALATLDHQEMEEWEPTNVEVQW